jgi:hypothetical protein
MFTLLFSVCVPACIIFFFYNKHDLKYIYVCLEFTKIIAPNSVSLNEKKTITNKRYINAAFIIK